jgi:GxxExxY protein
MPWQDGPYVEITDWIIECGMEVHRALGPGIFESVYRSCLVLELRERGLRVAERCRVPLQYKDRTLRPTLVMHLIVEEMVVVEVKAVEFIIPVHMSQLLTYLTLTGCPIGLLMNFNVSLLKEGIRRFVHPGLFRKFYPETPRLQKPT